MRSPSKRCTTGASRARPHGRARARTRWRAGDCGYATTARAAAHAPSAGRRLANLRARRGHRRRVAITRPRTAARGWTCASRPRRRRRTIMRTRGTAPMVEPMIAPVPSTSRSSRTIRATASLAELVRRSFGFTVRDVRIGHRRARAIWPAIRRADLVLMDVSCRACAAPRRRGFLSAAAGAAGRGADRVREPAVLLSDHLGATATSQAHVASTDRTTPVVAAGGASTGSRARCSRLVRA